MSIYKVAKGWAVFIYIACVLFIFLCGYGLFEEFQEGTANQFGGSFWWISALLVGAIVFWIFCIKEVANYTITVDDAGLSIKSFFTNRTLQFDAAEGLRMDRGNVMLFPKNAGEKKITISSYIGSFDELQSLLKAKLPDLDEVSIENEKKEILENEAYGLSTEERAENLSRAKKQALILNIASVIVAICFFFVPSVFNYTFIATLCIPVIAIVVFRTSKGLIHINSKKGTAYPSVYFAFFLPAIALLMKGLVAYNIDSHDNIWVPAIGIALALLTAIVPFNKETKVNDKEGFAVFFGIVIFAFVYGYGSVVTANCYYDRSTPNVYTASVISKRTSSGKSTTYYLDLTAWGKRVTNEEVSVASSLYKRVKEGDTVYIYYRHGRYNIPWFIVTDQ